MEELMKISYQFLAISLLYLTPLASMTQEVVPYANSDVKVDWVRGTDFSKYKTYAWGVPNQQAPDPNHPLDDIDAALQAKGLQRWESTQILVSSSLLALETSKYMYFSTSPKIQS
jgi:hypothetical protein